MNTFGWLPALPHRPAAVQVRELASAAAQDGTVDTATIKFVRHQKTTMLELQRRSAERAQEIMEKQARRAGVQKLWAGRGPVCSWLPVAVHAGAAMVY